MYAKRFYPQRYFPARYWPQGADGSGAGGAPTASPRRRGEVGTSAWGILIFILGAPLHG